MSFFRFAELNWLSTTEENVPKSAPNAERTNKKRPKEEHVQEVSLLMDPTEKLHVAKLMREKKLSRREARVLAESLLNKMHTCGRREGDEERVEEYLAHGSPVLTPLF